MSSGLWSQYSHFIFRKVHCCDTFGRIECLSGEHAVNPGNGKQPHQDDCEDGVGKRTFLALSACTNLLPQLSCSLADTPYSSFATNFGEQQTKPSLKKVSLHQITSLQL